MEDQEMPQKKHKPEEIVAKLRQVDILVSQGRPVAEAVWSIGVTQFTDYRWCKEFGGLKTDQVKRLKELEKENERLRKAVSEIKRIDSPQNKAKRDALAEWVNAVNIAGGFGRWAWDVAFDAAQVRDITLKHSSSW
jgi:putative transposase